MTESDILALVDRHPDGITSKQARTITGSTYVGSRLSRLFAYGKLSRRLPDKSSHEVLWLPKATRS